MKRYRIKSEILLTFLTPRDQYDLSFSDGELESDGSTIWWVKDGRRHESITTANATDLWTKERKIEEILPKWPRDAPLGIQRWFGVMEKQKDRVGGEMYLNMDTYRAAKLSDPAQVAEYEKKYHSGCCASHDAVIQGDDGSLWVVGFNYGH